MVQLLGSEKARDVAAQLVEELNKTGVSRENDMHNGLKSSPESEIFKRYPMLYATFLESSRYVRIKAYA